MTHRTRTSGRRPLRGREGERREREGGRERGRQGKREGEGERETGKEGGGGRERGVMLHYQLAEASVPWSPQSSKPLKWTDWT